MKKIFKYAALLMLASFISSSCIEDGTNEVDGVGKSRFRVPMAENYSLTAIDASEPSAGIFTVYRDAISNSDLNTAVTLNYAIDQTKLDEYNVEHELRNDSAVVQLNPSIYTLVGAADGKIEFAPGEASKEVIIELDISTLDFSTRYAIPFVFSSTDIEVSKTSEFAIIEVGVKNKYDGVYSYTGHVGRYDAATCELIELGGPVEPGVTVELSTTGANSVSMVALWATGGGIGGIGSAQMVTINPTTNEVTLTPVDATPTNWGPIAGEPNYYDPTTGDIFISYRWNVPCAGALYGYIRHIHVRMKYKQPR